MSKLKCSVSAWLSGFFLMASAGISAADEFHYTNIIVGERPAGLAGAYVGVSDDPSGLYYNPSGIVNSPGGNLSASVNAFFTSKKTYSDAIEGNSWNRKSASLLPNFFGIIQPLGKGVVGFSYAAPDSIVEDQDQTFTNISSPIPGTTVDRYVINFNKEDNTYDFGPSYAVKLSDNLSVGITAYMHYRRHQRISNQLTNLSDSRYQWWNVYFETSETGMKPVLGITWAPEDQKYTVGLSLSKVVLFNSHSTYQTTFHGINYSGTEISRTSIGSDKKREYPTSITLGMAYFPSHSLLVSGDVSYYSATGEVTDAATGLQLYSKKNSVINFAVGTEYYLNDKTAVRGGFFTNFANTPKVNAGQTDQDEHIDEYGLSLSGSFFSRWSSLTLGMTYTFGNGKAQVNADAPTTAQSVTTSSLLIYLGTSYSY